MTTIPDPPQDGQSSVIATRPLSPPGAEQPGTGAPVEAARPSTVATGDAISGEDEVALLGRICQLLVTALPVAAAAVTLVDERLNPTAAAASLRAMRTMIAAQFEYGEGPCLDACRMGEPVVETDVSLSRHWAGATEWRAVHTLPVRIDGRTVGVATLASVRGDGLTQAEISTAHSITTIAAAHASTMRALRGSRQLAAQLQHALYGRVEMIARRRTDTLAAPAHPADTKVTRIGFGPPRNLLSIVDTGKPRRVRLIGEADLSTEDQLTHALERLAGHPGDITLDIGDLRFIDARSTGLLVRAATALLPPDRLVLRHATGLVAKVFALLDIGDHPRILIA